MSATLGHLVIALHNGLLHAISNESQTAALVNMLRALQTLMLSAAYSRLPPDLLPRCIEASLPIALVQVCLSLLSKSAYHSWASLPVAQWRVCILQPGMVNLPVTISTEPP